MSIYERLVGQSAAVAEIKRAAAAARASHDAGQIVEASCSTSSSSEAGSSPATNSSAMTHAWLFTGPPGSGRSLAAHILAAALQCTGQIPGCAECAACKAVMSNNHPDVSWVRTDLVTLKAEEVRAYVAQSYVAPEQGKYRIFIVEDADRMLARTSNVLLKAIEEPAPRTVWMLCTTSAADVLPTIRSRTRNINLVAPSPRDVAQLLVSRDGIEQDKALIAAQAAQSHIGVARALAADPAASALRLNTLTALTSIKGVGDAVLAAQLFLDAEAMYSNSEKSEKESAPLNAPLTAPLTAEDEIARETQRRMEALGLDPNGKVPAAIKSQIKSDADDLKRRKTRMQRDMLDRELIYIESFFRDVMIMQTGASVALINADFSGAIEQRAADTSLKHTIACLEECAQARRRLQANVTPHLALEAALVSFTMTGHMAGNMAGSS